MDEWEKWDAVVNRDKRLDGVLCYGVVTTGVFCRPSCASRKPRRENAVFFDSPDEAAAAGFRPCKRCRPDVAGYAPERRLCEQAKRIIEERHNDTKAVGKELKALGVDGTHLARLFCRRYGVTPHRYMKRVRISEAARLISRGAGITEAAFACGYGSVSAFYRDFREATGTTPRQYAKAPNPRGLPTVSP